MKFSDLATEPERNLVKELIDRRWHQTYALYREAVGRALSYLLLTNASGAVAVLSGIAASAELRANIGIRISLGCFALGVILVGVLNVMLLYWTAQVFQGWHADSSQFYGGQVEWEALHAADRVRGAERPGVMAVGFTGFIVFVLGVIIGLASFLCPS